MREETVGSGVKRVESCEGKRSKKRTKRRERREERRRDC